MPSDPAASPRQPRCPGASLAQYLWAGVYSLGAVAAVLLMKFLHLSWPLRAAVVLLAIVPGVIYILTMIRDVRRLDELQRRIYLEAISVAFAGTFLFTTLYPTLRKAGFLPEMEATFVSVVMVAIATVSYFVSAWRYR